MTDTGERLEGWVRLHQPVVYRAAWLILRDDAAAEDVAQETFLRAFRNADKLEPEADARPWLYRIAVNLALNRLRSRRREARAVTRLGPRVALWEDDASERGVGDNTVADALRRLPDRLRVPVILRYYLDLSEKDIARALGVRAGTTKSRLSEARRLLAADKSIATAAGKA
ncbi:MAG: sigma-70 family RNA polymerase sigma factor [Actinomycetota bacterium]|nr:sigma-70 family RNA polymerase sigma factor [Actinomycetota bacterium]